MKQFQFNKAHREGLARVFDNILTACALSLGISLSGHNNLTINEDALLILTGSICLLLTYILRKDLS